jgi:hypothetical protein
MVRYLDAKLELAVQRAADRIHDLAQSRKKRPKALTAKSKLIARVGERFESTLGEWLGAHQVPRALAKAKVEVVRSIDGMGLGCSPSLSEKQLPHARVERGDGARAILAVLEAFAHPESVDKVVSGLCAKKIDAGLAHETIAQLAAGGFLAAPGNPPRGHA